MMKIKYKVIYTGEIEVFPNDISNEQICEIIEEYTQDTIADEIDWEVDDYD